jgi:hypothetical protein
MYDHNSKRPGNRKDDEPAAAVSADGASDSLHGQSPVPAACAPQCGARCLWPMAKLGFGLLGMPAWWPAQNL